MSTYRAMRTGIAACILTASSARPGFGETGPRTVTRTPPRVRRRFLRVALAAAAIVVFIGSSGFAQSEHKRTADDQTITLNSDLVTLSVTVTGDGGRLATGLRAQDFVVFDNDVEQSVRFFSADAVPVSWGLVLDRSGSMADMMRDVYSAATHVIDEGTREDEVFVATFDERVSLATGFVSDRHRLGNSLLDLAPGGMTALWDAIAFGLDQSQGAKHRKKVLVVVTDGEDNASTTTLRRVVERAETDGTLIYPVGMFEGLEYSRFGVLSKDAASTRARFGLELLATATGAAAHFPSDVAECKRVMATIAQEVRRQYTLAFYPTNVARDGKWHAIRVVVRTGDPSTEYVVRTRPGYYATGGENEP